MLPQLPSRAFGDGSHPTTRLCAGAVRALSAKRVLDVGTGTGILARIARARGATRIVATDIDPLALDAARANFALDDSRVPIELSTALPDHWGPAFDLVVANILQKPLLQLAPLLIAALAPGGSLLLSGFSSAESPVLRVGFAPLRTKTEASMDGWSLLHMHAGS